MLKTHLLLMKPTDKTMVGAEDAVYYLLSKQLHLQAASECHLILSSKEDLLRKSVDGGPQDINSTNLQSRNRHTIGGKVVGPGVCKMLAQVLNGSFASGSILGNKAQECQHCQPSVLKLLDFQVL